MRASTRPRIFAIAREIAVISLFVVTAIVMTWPLLPQARTHIVDIGVDDTLLYTRYARCFRDWLIGREPGYLSFDMYFPSLLSGATNDPSLGVAVQVLPLAIFFRDYLFTVNLVSLASFVMCAHATYLLVREISHSRGAGIVAGLAFAFCFYRIRQLDHPNVLQMQWLPYALFFMHRLANAPTRKNAAVFSVFLFFALTASFNVAVYSSLVFPVVGAWLVLTAPQHRFRLIRWLLASCAAVAVPLYFVYRPFFILRDAGSPVREEWEIKQFSSSLESFEATPADLFSTGAHPVHLAPESVMFLGWSVLVLAAVGVFGLLPRSSRPVISPKREWLLIPFGVARAAFLLAALVLISFFAIWEPTARQLLVLGVGGACVIALVARFFHPTREAASPAPIYVSVALFYAACCFGLEVMDHGASHGHGLWSQVQRIPGFDQIRTPSRFFLVTSLCAAICAGLGAKAIAFAFPRKFFRALAFVAMSCGVLFDLKLPTIPTRIMPTEASAPPIYRALANASKPGAVVELPVEWNERARRGVYYANIHGKPTINGVSAWGLYYLNGVMGSNWQKPPSEYPYSPVGVEALRATYIAGLRYVVVHRAWISEKDQSLYAAGINELGGKLVGTFDTDDLFELPDPPPSRPARAADIDVTFENIDWRDRAAREVFLTVKFVSHTGDNLYEPVIKHFSVDATSAGETIGTGDGYLMPPLFTPHGSFESRYRMKVVRRPRPDWVEVHLKDDDGNSWGTARMRLPD